MLNIFKRKKRLNEMTSYLNNLVNDELVLLSTGYFTSKNNKTEIVYDKIRKLLKNKELEQLSDKVLVDLIKQIDDAFTSIKNNELFYGKTEYIKEIANEIKKISPLRLNKLVHNAELLIQNSNNLIKQGLLNEIDYVEIYNTKLMIEYYLNEVFYSEKLQKLDLELAFIFNKKCQFKIPSFKRGKMYEKTRVSI